MLKSLEQILYKVNPYNQKSGNMEMIQKLKNHYEQNPPYLSYESNQGNGLKFTLRSERAGKEEFEFLGVGSAVVWRADIQDSEDVFPVEGYGIVEAILDVSGVSIPEELSLFPEMEGHAVNIIVYVDMLNCVRLKATGAYTSHETRSSEIEKRNRVKMP